LLAKEEVSAESRRRDLNKSTMNIPSECRIASIGPNHATILPSDPNSTPDQISGKDRAR